MELSGLVNTGGIIKREAFDRYIIELGLLPSDAVKLEQDVSVEPIRQEWDDEDPQEDPKKDLTSLYLFKKEAEKIPLLTAEEERALSYKVHHAKDKFTRIEARNALVEHNLLFSLWMARKFASKTSASFGIEDLIQECNQGLMYAAEIYDGSKGVRFCNYAYYCIYTYITRAVAGIGFAYKVPQAFPERYNRLKTAEALVQSRNKGVASLTDTVKEYNTMFPKEKITLQCARETMKLYPFSLSLESPVSEEGSNRHEIMKDLVADEAPTPVDIAEIEARKKFLSSVMDAVLNDREKAFIKAKYGLDDNAEEQIRAIAERFGVSPQRASKICQDAEGKLGRALRKLNFQDNMLGI